VKLTPAQRHNLEMIRKAGGTVRRVRFQFCGADDKPIRGMNRVAVASLVKLGLLMRVVGETAERSYEMFTLMHSDYNTKILTGGAS
jgi:hypothetical protein